MIHKYDYTIEFRDSQNATMQVGVSDWEGIPLPQTDIHLWPLLLEEKLRSKLLLHLHLPSTDDPSDKVSKCYWPGGD
jgi:hypothetical protein